MIKLNPLYSVSVLASATLLAACGSVAPDAGEIADENRGETSGETTSTVAIPAGLEPGSNEMLRAPITAAPELEVLISDVIIPPGAEVPRHYHPGEEFVYVIEGSAVHREEGKPDRFTKAGDAMVVPPQAVHAPQGGPEGARAIVFRVHIEGQPERIPVPEE